jgi:DNA repair protein RecN (Recombination protein N)
MLRELHIQNLAVIQDAHVLLQPGLNCFTGQTGAGKSLMLGAFEILLGLKAAAANMLRPGADEARVAGLFELQEDVIAAQVSAILDMPLKTGDDVLISRRILPSGRSSVSANGQVVTAAMVRQVSELLVDIHGQHDQQYLLKPANQLMILDAFAQALPVRERYGELYKEHARIQRRRDELAASRTLRQQQLELYLYQAGEIDAAAPQPGELATCKARSQKLANIQRIERDVSGVRELLDDGEAAVNPQLQRAVHLLENLARLDAELEPQAEQVRSAVLMLQDSAYEMARYTQRLELDPEELSELETRLNVLNRLVAKYAPAAQPGVDPIETVLAYRLQIQSFIEQLQAEDEDLATIDQQAVKIKTALLKAGGELSRKRQTAARKLRPLVEDQLKQLGMGEAAFDVAFTRLEGTNETSSDEAAAQDAQADELSLTNATAHGLESAEMMVRTNPGQPLLALRKIASGGEMSRIMLAIKAILAQSDRVSVLVFDEIDANIGGRMGTVIGQKLRLLANQAHHQVLCITHLPQIAAFADHHLHITKSVRGKGPSRETCTTVTPLEGAQRIEELAQMLAGAETTSTTRKQARELLCAAG